MFKEAIVGDRFYSLKYRKWFVIDSVRETGIIAMVSYNCPKQWNFEGYLITDGIYGYPDAMWVEPDFKDTENVRPRPKKTIMVNTEGFVNVYPMAGRAPRTGNIYAPDGDLICLHETKTSADRDLEPDGRTYHAKFTISYEVET